MHIIHNRQAGRAFGITCLLWLAACTGHNIPGSSFTPSGLEYKILYLGDEQEKPRKGDIVKINWQLLNKFGKHARSGVLSLEYSGREDAGFQELISKLYIGDSAVFMADSTSAALLHITLPQNQMRLTVKPFAVADTLEERYESHFPGITSGVQTTGDRACYRVFDTLMNKPAREMDGMYIFSVRAGTGTAIQTGRQVTLHYEGFLLNGKKIDSTIDRDEPFVFFAGDPDQLIPGITQALSCMKKGDETVLVIPPHLAFGNGSGSGIVPPQSTVIYYIKVEDVKLNNRKKS